MSESKIAQLAEAVGMGEEDDAIKFTQQLLDEGTAAADIIKNAIEPAMDDIGERFGAGEAFLPELILAGDAASATMEILLEKLTEEGGAGSLKGTIVLGVMYGDHHDIGKNLVKALLSANGFKVIDLGINVVAKQFIEVAKKEKADIIACSALITTSLPFQRDLINLLNDMGSREDHYIILGGGPVTPQWAEEIKADGYGFTGADCVTLCKKLSDNSGKPSTIGTVIEGALT
jgi:methylmalonyl-CoA mutase cobalamin-binding domain/chain